jgi:transposase
MSELSPRCSGYRTFAGREARRHLAQPDPDLVKTLEAGVFDEDGQAADLLPEYEAKIAALERMVGRQALEIEFLKGALKNARRSKSATTSAITGLMVSPLPKDAA